MDYTVELSDEASQQRSSLSQTDQRKVDRGLSRIRESPFCVPGHTVPLRGQSATSTQLSRAYRYRAGDLRIFYVIDRNQRTVYVLSVERRTTTTYR